MRRILADRLAMATAVVIVLMSVVFALVRVAS
ncbi:hypothetical protein SAMN04515669_4157 [Jiangella sp. DSM 45060]|nr:hypothetical protein SAMN04515669_4157 [Jiangella sp. DSM 45060]